MQDVKTDRYKYIGGSDIPIIMGISHFKDRYTLLLEKAQLKDDDFEGNTYTEYGNVMEPKIRQYINTLYQRNFVEDKLGKNDIMCHFDGIDDEMILEIKTTSIIHENILDYKVYLVQLLFYMMNANKDKGILAVYERPDDFNEKFDDDRLQVLFINIDDYKELCVEIMESVEQFRIDLEKIRNNPFLTEEDLMPKDLVSLANEVVKLEKSLQQYKELTKRYDEFRAKLKELMQEKGITHWETNGGAKITLVEDTEDKVVNEIYFDEMKFALENADLHDKYMTSKEVVKKGKKGYVKITLGKDNAH